MAKYVSVGKVADLQPGQMKRVAVDRERVLLVNVEGDHTRNGLRMKIGDRTLQPVCAIQP